MTFEGVAIQLTSLKEPVDTYWSQLPLLLLLWTDGNDTISRYALFCMLAIQTWIVPMILWTLLSLWWCGSHHTTTTRWILTLYPTLANSLVAAVSMIWCIVTFRQTQEQLLNDAVGNVCEQIQNISGATCLEMIGSVGVGGWLFLVHAISLEAFCFVTIYTAKLKRHQRGSS
eukprot:CAMPEP_0194038810 /NCGR_PEP_ID=MMETSP0009_2-20130614/11035_1 /TAXON_ID=210454 /ORGANISM="Grammatophora oceanica, Strain CCMP 410" /LENGTH=171 /DNA_ID=CAMNT_0038681443 /DNA_START=1171 /DNA_END=1686 /DNA_ORIENTATION=+